MPYETKLIQCNWQRSWLLYGDLFTMEKLNVVMDFVQRCGVERCEALEAALIACMADSY